jgi:hypothetical protein
VEEAASGKLFERLFWPLTRLMLVIGAGLAAGEWIEASGWTRALAFATRPFFRFGNLGHRCGAAFMTAFVSGVTSNAMLLQFYQDGKISRTQLFLANFVNQFPAFFLHLPTTFFIVVPLTGLAGVIYLAVTFAAVLLRTTLFLVYGHIRPSIRIEAGDNPVEPVVKKKRSRQEVWITLKKKLPGRFMGVAIYVVPIYVAVYFLNVMGLFTHARDWLAAYVTTSIVPMESLSIVILSFAAEFTSGFAAAGALMDAGMLSIKQTVTALIVGNIIAFPIRTLRHQLPRYMGIFAPRMGLQLLLLGQGFRVMSLIVVGAVFYCIW